ncbi:MAG: sensor histidine kinase [Pseudomonadota bacterium]
MSLFYLDKRRFLLLLGTLIGTGFLLISVLAYLAAQSSIRAGISDHALPLTADTIYSEIQKDLLRPVFISSMMAQDTFVRDWLLEGEREPHRIAAYLAKIQEEYQINSSFLVSERSRTYYIPGGVLKTVDQTDVRDGWYFRVRDMVPAHEINLDIDEAYEDRHTVFVNFKVFGKQGEFLGATGVGLSTDAIAAHVRRYEATFQRHIYFVSPRGQVILAGSANRPVGASILSLEGIRTIARDILAEHTAPRSLVYPGHLAQVQVNARYIPELSAHLVVEQPEEAVLHQVRSALLVNIVLGLVLCLLVLMLAYRVMQRYLLRIETLAREAVESAARETELARNQQEFVAMVSHEFGTPLAIIDTTLQGLKRDAAGAPVEVRDRLGRLQRASLRLKELMENYLTEDRLSHLDQSIRMDEVDLASLVSRIVRRTEWSGLELTLAEESALRVRGDPELLRIAISNLISNAVKYSEPEGLIRVAVGVNGAGLIELAVCDQGPGLFPEDLPRVFERNFRAKNSKPGGVGLGLYLVQRIACLHGGSVEVVSALSQGTCFHLRVPRLGP